MKKLLWLLVLLPSFTFASTTWSTTPTGAKAVCTTGSESAPTLVTEGLRLDASNSGVRAVKSFTVHAETAGTMTAGGVLQAYLWNPTGNSGNGQWNRAPDLDLTVSALASQAFPGFTVTSPVGRIAYVPSGVGLAVTIYINVTN